MSAADNKGKYLLYYQIEGGHVSILRGPRIGAPFSVDLHMEMRDSSYIEDFASAAYFSG